MDPLDTLGADLGRRLDSFPLSVSREAIERLVARGDVQADPAQMAAVHRRVTVGIAKCREELRARARDGVADIWTHMEAIHSGLDNLQAVADICLEMVERGRPAGP